MRLLLFCCGCCCCCVICGFFPFLPHINQQTNKHSKFTNDCVLLVSADIHRPNDHFCLHECEWNECNLLEKNKAKTKGILYINIMENCLTLRIGEACKRTKWAFFKLRKQMRIQFKICAENTNIHVSAHIHTHTHNHHTERNMHNSCECGCR